MSDWGTITYTGDISFATPEPQLVLAEWFEAEEVKKALEAREGKGVARE